MIKPFNEEQIHAAQCMGFEVSEDCNKVVAKIDTTSKEAMLEFLRYCDRGLIESPAQLPQRKVIFGKLKEAYSESYKQFIKDFEPHKLYDDVGRKLYKHQIDTLWLYQKKKINLCSFEQGLGKTIFAASISKLFKVPRTIVVGPSLVKWNWVKDLSDDWGYNEMFFTVLDSQKSMEAIMHERFVITNYEMINKFWSRLTSKDCGHIIIDECFSYDTPILTDKGTLPIGYVVENKIDCRVLSRNHNNGSLEFNNIAFYGRKERKERFVTIYYEYGELTCTENHKIFTRDRGYVKAIDLSSDDYVEKTEEKYIHCYEDDEDFMSKHKSNYYRVMNVSYNDRDDKYVYDIEVENNHNFYADNILVHNCHYAKNHSSGRSKAVQKLIKHYPKARVTLLTGTPVTNRVTDLFAYLKIGGHPLGKNFTQFKAKYAKGKQKITGVKNPEDLRMRISNFIVRKKTQECIDLPELRVSKYYFDMNDSDVKEYNKMMDELYEVEQQFQALNDKLKAHKAGDIVLSKNEKGDIHKDLRDLRMKKNSSIHTMNRLCANAKIPNIIKLVDNLNEQEEKVIVFSGYREPMDRLKEHYGDKAVIIDGSVPAKERQNRIDRFKEDPTCTVFIAQFIAGGIGINLTNCRKTIFTNFPFTPDLIEQPMKRSHRGGQKRDVDILFTMIPESIDERIYGIIQSKGDDINKIIDHDKSDKMEYGSLKEKLFESQFTNYEKKHNIQKTVTRKFKEA